MNQKKARQLGKVQEHLEEQGLQPADWQRCMPPGGGFWERIRERFWKGIAARVGNFFARALSDTLTAVLGSELTAVLGLCAVKETDEERRRRGEAVSTKD